MHLFMLASHANSNKIEFVHLTFIYRTLQALINMACAKGKSKVEVLARGCTLPIQKSSDYDPKGTVYWFTCYVYMQMKRALGFPEPNTCTVHVLITILNYTY